MDVIGVIPARYSSTRFEGKVLADILGKSMLQHVWERAKEALLLEDLIIACDDERIKTKALEFGAKVVFTSKAHPSGADRITEVVNPLDAKVIVNIQADEPLVHPSMIDEVARAVLEDPKVSVATVMKRIEDTQQLNDPNVVKVVVNKLGFALYFSRSLIPHRQVNSEVLKPNYYKHIGLYAYSKDFLFTFRNLPPLDLEKTECLEQLRVLEYGYNIKVVETKFETIGVDTLKDLEKVKEYLAKEKR